MLYQIAYLDFYGNAEALAGKIEQSLPPGTAIRADLAKSPLSGAADGYLVCFEMLTWQSVPLDIIDALESMGGKRIALFVLSDFQNSKLFFTRA